MMVDVYCNVYIFTAQVRPFIEEGVYFVLHTYIPRWRRCIHSLQFLTLLGFRMPQSARTIKEVRTPTPISFE